MKNKYKGRLKILIAFGILFLVVSVLLTLIFLESKKSYTVRFDPNGGTVLSGSLEQRVMQGQDAVPPSVVMDGAVLRGWSASYRRITRDIVIEAVWEYETTAGIIYTENENQNFTEIQGSYPNLRGEVYLDAFFNEKKLCQASEIIQSGSCAYVRVSKGCYYNSFLTNDIYTAVLSDQEGTRIHPPLNASTYPIKKLDESVFSNHMGVTTLAVSSDNYVMILRHNNKTAISANKLAGSGSGSVDFTDWHQSTDTDLREIIIRTAHRELYEEAGFKELEKQGIKIDSKVIGMFRNLERGGKPDYCLVTYIDADHFVLQDAFKAEKKEVVNNSQFVPIAYADGQYDLTKLAELLHDKQNSVSISLYMNFYFLERYLGKANI